MCFKNIVPALKALVRPPLLQRAYTSREMPLVLDFVFEVEEEAGAAGGGGGSLLVLLACLNVCECAFEKCVGAAQAEPGMEAGAFRGSISLELFNKQLRAPLPVTLAVMEL